MRILRVFVIKDIMEQMRTRKLMILVAVFIFLGVASPIFAKLMPEIFKGFSGQAGVTIKIPPPTFNDAIDQFIKNTSQMVVLLLVFIVAGAVVDEKVKKSLELVIVKPVSRTSFILSKFIAYFLTISTLFLLSAVVFYFYTVSLFVGFNPFRFLIVSLLALIYVLLIVTVTIFTSTVVRSAAIAGVIGILSSIILGSVLSAIPATADYSPGFIMSNYRQLMLKGWSFEFLPPLIVSGMIILTLVYFAAHIFQRQEIER